jgi:adenylate cyclase
LLSDVKLEFELPLVEFKVRDLYAKVVNSKQEGDRHLAGLEFTSISPETDMKIQLLVQLLVTEAAA